jgi:hypothetical protein
MDDTQSQGFANNGTQWDDFTKKHPPVPEPADYGFVFMIIMLIIYARFKFKKK